MSTLAMTLAAPMTVFSERFSSSGTRVAMPREATTLPAFSSEPDVRNARVESTSCCFLPETLGTAKASSRQHVPSTSLPCRTTQVSHWQDRPDVCRKRICDKSQLRCTTVDAPHIRCPSELMYIPQQGDQAGRPHKPSPAIQLRTNRAGLKTALMIQN